MKTKYTTREIYLTSGQVEKLSAALAKRSSISLMIFPGTSNKTAVKVMLTQQQINKLDLNKPFVLKLSVSQVTAMSKQGGFLGPALSVIASKVLPVLGTLGLAAASGAVSGATKKAVEGRGIKQIYR